MTETQKDKLIVHLKVEIDRLKYTITVLKECTDAKDCRIAELEMRVEGQDLHSQGQNDAIANRDATIRRLLKEVDHWEIRWRNRNDPSLQS